MGYAAIDSYGMIGNMRTAALVARSGSIDWLCVPHFDSPSVFGAILDREKGGSFSLEPDDEEVHSTQFYLPDTNVLVTRFRTSRGVGEVLDFMPVRLAKHDEHMPGLIRIVRVDQGRVPFIARCRPAFDYARAKHELAVDGALALFKSGRTRLAVCGTCDLQGDERGVEGRVALERNQRAVFTLWWSGLDHDGEPPRIVDADEAGRLHDDTVSYWRKWVGQCTYRGRWRELVRRSALALKLMTFEPTGAIIAAPTTSLPEHVGGGRNWDYRYTWLRDAAFTVYALQHIGFASEAIEFVSWLQERLHEMEPGRMLRPVYGIDGRHELPEEELPHLEGYKGSRPVRIGNAACDQLQIDVVGALVDALYLFDRHALPLSHDMWTEVRRLLDWTCKNWRCKDNGVWEVRGIQREFVHSRLMCWVGLDRGIRIAERRGFPADIPRWREQRDAIYQEIMERGWNSKRRAFVQHYGSDALDAANLMMPLVRFLSPNDPRMMRTLEAMQQPLAEGGLMDDFVIHRYDPEKTADGVDGEEGAFNMCTFWLAEALTRAGRVDRSCLERGRLIFERLAAHAGPLGLFAEQTGSRREACGNYPQGLTHLSLIVAAHHLDRALDQ